MIRHSRSCYAVLAILCLLQAGHEIQFGFSAQAADVDPPSDRKPFPRARDRKISATMADAIQALNEPRQPGLGGSPDSWAAVAEVLRARRPLEGVVPLCRRIEAKPDITFDTMSSLEQYPSALTLRIYGVKAVPEILRYLETQPSPSQKGLQAEGIPSAKTIDLLARLMLESHEDYFLLANDPEALAVATVERAAKDTPHENIQRLLARMKEVKALPFRDRIRF